MSILYGFFFGFMLGAGCAVAIMYAVYLGGYRKAVSDSLLRPLPNRYQQLLKKQRAPASSRADASNQEAADAE